MITLPRFNQKKLDMVKSLLKDGVPDVKIEALGYSKGYLQEARRQERPLKCFHNKTSELKRCKCGARCYADTLDIAGWCIGCNMAQRTNLERDWRRKV